MEPIPKVEVPKSPPSPEAKAPPPPKEKPMEKPATAPAGTPRATLEAIASGKPVAEATTPIENLPNRETVTALLTEANSILLELRDMRLLVNSVATQAADTPLGNEVRMDALRSILTMETQGLPPATATQLTAMQEKIKALNIPPHKPEQSAVLGLIASYNQMHPDKPIPEDIIEAVRSGKRDVAPVVAQMLQTNDALSEMTWRELTGREGFTRLTMSPERVLALSGLPQTPENMTKAQELFGVAKTMKEPPKITGDQVVMGLMYGAIGLQFFTQLTTQEPSGGGGH